MSELLKKKNDKLIQEFLKDPNHMVFWSGEIMTRVDRQGHVQNEWRSCLNKKEKLKGQARTNYWRVRYKGVQLQAHRIVYAKFIGELHHGMVINHKDGDGLNNSVENLELITQSENNTHKYRVLGHSPSYGNAKINQKIADAIRADRAKGLPYSALKAKYKVSMGTLSEIMNNKIWIAS